MDGVLLSYVPFFAVVEIESVEAKLVGNLSPKDSQIKLMDQDTGGKGNTQYTMNTACRGLLVITPTLAMGRASHHLLLKQRDFTCMEIGQCKSSLVLLCYHHTGKLGSKLFQGPFTAVQLLSNNHFIPIYALT